MSWEMAKPLYEHQVEFNYLEEELLPVCEMKAGCLSIQKQKYSWIITDGNVTEQSKKILDLFQKEGGHVLLGKRYGREKGRDSSEFGLSFCILFKRIAMHIS